MPGCGIASAFNDEALNSLLGLLRKELMREQASTLSWRVSPR